MMMAAENGPGAPAGIPGMPGAPAVGGGGGPEVPTSEMIMVPDKGRFADAFNSLTLHINCSMIS